MVTIESTLDGMRTQAPGPGARGALFVHGLGRSPGTSPAMERPRTLADRDEISIMRSQCHGLAAALGLDDQPPAAREASDPPSA